MNLVVVNYVYRTKFLNCEDFILEKIATLIPEATLRSSHPRQVVSRIGKVTCMFFPKGAIRIMGGEKSEIESVEAALEYLQNFVLFWLPPNFEATPIKPIQVQTMTVISSLPEPINLYKFHECIKSYYEFELFSALHITKYGTICVNLFSTGKMVLTGCKSKQEAKSTVEDIYLHYRNDYTIKKSYLLCTNC